MNVARAGSVDTVRSGLRILVWCFVAAAALAVTSRLAAAHLVEIEKNIHQPAVSEVLAIDAVHPSHVYSPPWYYGVLSKAWVVFRLGSIAVAITIAIAIARFRELAPFERAVTRGTPYRGAVTMERRRVHRGLSLALLAATGTAAAVDLCSLAWDLFRVPLLTVHGAMPRVVLWVLTWAAAGATAGLLVTWVVRVARDLAIRLPEPLAMGLLAIILGRTAFAIGSFLWAFLGHPMLPAWSSSLSSVVWIATYVALALLLARLEGGLGALPAGDAGELGRPDPG